MGIRPRRSTNCDLGIKSLIFTITREHYNNKPTVASLKMKQSFIALIMTWIKIFPIDAVSVLSGAATQLRVSQKKDAAGLDFGCILMYSISRQ